MPRYIDADVLRTSIETDRDASDMPKMWYEGIAYAINHIIHAPTADVVETPRWIPVTERLPEEGKRVLVTYDLVNKYSWVNILHYGKPMYEDKTCFYASDSEWGDVPYEGIFAWMPLPEPYRKETEDD